MYTQEDINAAVASGALTQEAADALRMQIEEKTESPIIDEENFRLITSFNDIFVSIGIIITLIAVGAIAQQIVGFDQSDGPTSMFNVFKSTLLLSSVLSAATAWGLAEFFTRKRRMALPSIILQWSFASNIFFGAGAIMAMIIGEPEGTTAIALAVAICGLLTAGACYVHWLRFMVPITVATGACAVTITLGAFIVMMAAPEEPMNLILGLAFVAGLAIFAFAMRWDMSDPKRQTRRSDIAFWLHLLASPLIAHPVFYAMGAMDSDSMAIGSAVGILIMYIVFGVVALIVDRRALLVSALAYVLIALAWLLNQVGAVGLAFALTALVIGSALLCLSAFWTPLRGRVLGLVPPAMRENLPAAA